MRYRVEVKVAGEWDIIGSESDLDDAYGLYEGTLEDAFDDDVTDVRLFDVVANMTIQEAEYKGA